MKTTSHQLTRVTTARGTRYYIDGRRVTRDAMIDAKHGPGKRQDCYITRADRHAVRQYSILTISIP